MTDWMKQYPSVFITRTYDGDRLKAVSYIGEGNKLLYQVKNNMGFNNLGRLKMERVFKDAETGGILSVIKAESVFGHDTIHIYCPPVVAVVAVVAVVEGMPVMATFDDPKIYFEVANPLSGGENCNFYIDLAPVFLTKGHTNDNIPYALKIIEYAPNMGILVYFRSETLHNIELAYVLRFEVTTKLNNTITYGGKNYEERSFNYSYDEFNIRDSTITPLVIFPQCTADIPGRPYGTADTWYEVDGAQYQAVGDETTLFGCQIYADSYYWIGTNTADHTEYTGLYNHLQTWSGDPDPQKFIVPIGASTWLKKTDGSLDDIEWSIHFSCLGNFKFYMHVDWSNNTPNGAESGSYVALFRTFQVPFIIFAKRDEGIVFQDPQNLFSMVWAIDGVISGPLSGTYEYGPINTHDEQEPSAPPGVKHWDIKINDYPVTWASGSEWQGSYRCVYPLFTSSGALNKYLIRYTKIGYTQPWWTHPDWEKPYEVIYLNEYRVGAFYYKYDGINYKTLGMWPPVYPRVELFGRGPDQTWLNFLKPWGYPYRHQGGGNNGRFMLRIAPDGTGENVGEGINRSIYVVNGTLYDYGASIGKVSRELLIAQSILSTNDVATLDSTIVDNYGNATLIGKYPNYEDLSSYESSGGYQVADFGMINKNFFT